jgi:hypothetical protein
MPVIDLQYNLEEQSSGFEPLPADQYKAKIVKIELGESQTGNPKLDVQWEVVEGEYTGRKIFDTVPLHVGFRVKQYADLAGIESGSTLDTSLMMDAEAILSLSVESREGYDDRNKIKKIIPAD